MQEYRDRHIALEWTLDLTLLAEVESVAADKHGKFGGKRLCRDLVFFLDAEPCQRVWF